MQKCGIANLVVLSNRYFFNFVLPKFCFIDVCSCKFMLRTLWFLKKSEGISNQFCACKDHPIASMIILSMIINLFLVSLLFMSHRVVNTLLHNPLKGYKSNWPIYKVLVTCLINYQSFWNHCRRVNKPHQLMEPFSHSTIILSSCMWYWKRINKNLGVFTKGLFN